MSSLSSYYVYINEDNKMPYFYNIETKATTYKKPDEGIFLNPINDKPFFDEDGCMIDYGTNNLDDSSEDSESQSNSYEHSSSENHSEEDKKEKKGCKKSSKVKRPGPKKHSHSDDSDHNQEAQISMTDDTQQAKNQADINLDVPEQVTNFDESHVRRQQQRKKTFDRASATIKIGPDGIPSLPSDLQADIQKFQDTNYFKLYFQEHRNQHKFSRKNISIDSISEFSTEPLTEPLIPVPPKDTKLVKLALQSFKYILYYTKVIPQKNPKIYLTHIVDLLYSNPQLRDETMFQLIKQTRKPPAVKESDKEKEEEWLRRTWMLFVVVVTVFPSSRNSEVWIKSHLARESKSHIDFVSQYASFSYIRFSARCSLGKPMDPPSEIDYFNKIPSQMGMGFQAFGASIYEQIWNQRRTLLRLPIPFYLYIMSKMLIEKGAEHVEGIFRLPGNMKLVEETADHLNKGENTLDHLGVHDLASLLKKWVRELPDPLVNLASVGLLETAFEQKTYLEFTEGLPKTHQLTLKYLIGFLQHLVKSQNETKMTPKNFAIVFGPNIVQLRDATEPGVIKQYSDIGIEYLTTLIEQWDTSEMYPLDPKYLQP